MQTKSLIIKHIQEIPNGSLLYYPELGDGLLCVSAKYDGELGESTVIVPLSGTSASPYALQPLRADQLSGRAVMVDGVKAEVDLCAATRFGNAVAYANNNGTYVRLRSERTMMASMQCLQLDDGIIRSYPPTAGIGFARWRIVMEEDPSEELWNSDMLINEETAHG